MKRLLVVVLALAACRDAPTSIPTMNPSLTVDPLALVTICRTGPDQATAAVAEPAARNMVAKGNARLGPCPPELETPPAGAVIPQVANPGWCSGGYGSEIPFTWQQGRDPQKRVARYEIVAQHTGSIYPIVAGFTPDTGLLFRNCGYVVDQNLSQWHWRVRAFDHQGQPGAWSDSVEFSFAPLPAPPAPTPLSPSSGTVFSNFPRMTTVTWTPVPAATQYQVEWGYCQEYPNFWDWANCDDWGGPATVTSATTSATFNFVGNQAGRWRVRAITPVGPTPWSAFWYFVYTV